MKTNRCKIEGFSCQGFNCCYYVAEDKSLKKSDCKYLRQGVCTSAVAQVNAMVLELKKLGVNLSKTEGSPE